MPLSASELILNPDQSIYHLNLHPGDVADTIITVGDPDRVERVSSHFDQLELCKGKREFISHTGTLRGKRLTVISTGIGTDNIDIVLNELDALVNIDFASRTVRPSKKNLTIVRLGTSGAIQPDIPLDTMLIGKYALGLDSLLHFYHHGERPYRQFERAFKGHMKWSESKSEPYLMKADEQLLQLLHSEQTKQGITATNAGFYGPQGRYLRLQPDENQLIEKMATFEYEGLKITNMEMESSAIYALAWLLGHRAVSVNCIIANRALGKFSESPGKAIEAMLTHVLDKLTSQVSS